MEHDSDPSAQFGSTLCKGDNLAPILQQKCSEKKWVVSIRAKSHVGTINDQQCPRQLEGAQRPDGLLSMDLH